MKVKWLIISLVLVCIIVILYSLGFRITYAPELENNWTAIDAVGTWAGVFSPLLLAILNSLFVKNVEKTKDEISHSNKIILEYNADNLSGQPIEKRILDYIAVAITPSTEDISKFLKLDIDEVFELLCEMENDNKITGINHRKSVASNKIIWKISR